MNDDEDEDFVPPPNKATSEESQPEEPNTYYTPEQIQTLRILYVIAVVVWIAFVFYMGYHKNLDIWGIIIMCIPVIIYLISFYNVQSLTIELEGKYFSVTYISIALMVAVAFLTWTYTSFKTHTYVVHVLIQSIILAVISLYDVWSSKTGLTYMKHIRSMLQVASLTLIVFAMYLLYRSSPYLIKPEVSKI